MASVQVDPSDNLSHSDVSTPGSSPLITPNSLVFPPTSNAKSAQLDVPHILLPAAPIEEKYPTPVFGQWSNPALQNYRAKHPPLTREKTNPFSTSHSFGGSLRVDTSAPSRNGTRTGTLSASTSRNGSLSASSSRNGGLAPMGQWKPSTPSTKVSGSTPRRTPRGPYRPRRNEDLFTALQKTVECVEKFEGTNYPSWSYWFKRKALSVPGRKDIWGHIDGTCPRPVEEGLDITDFGNQDTIMDPTERWDMDEAAIYCALFSSVTNTVAQSHVEGCTTAKEIWDHLELVYGDPDVQMTKTAQLVRALAQGDDLNVMEKLTKNLDGTISDELALWFIYDSMPGRFAAEIREMRKDNLSIPDAIKRLKALLKTKPGPTHRVKTATLPLDLRHYKYTGNGEESDGQLYARVQDTCFACLGTGHAAFSTECPQTEVRLGLWGKKDPIVTEQSCRMVSQTGRTVSGQQHRGLGLGLPGGVRMARTISTGSKPRPGLSMADASPNWRD